MKLAALVTAVLAGLLAAGPASAAGWTGTVVAKDAERSAAITALPSGAVRTVRLAPARFRGVRVGQRLAVVGTERADGTFAGRSVRVVGRASTARMRAVVVRDQPALRRILVSAGGSVLAVRRAGARTLSGGAGLRAGDEIVAKVRLARGALIASSVSEVGQLGMLELEGIVTELSSTSVTLVVAKAGFVTVTVPAGLTLPASLARFDQVELVVSVSATGAFTLVALDADDDDDHGLEAREDEDELEVEGTITSLSPLTVQPAAGSAVSCAVPAGMTLTGFAVGDRVEMECELVAGTLVLSELEAEDDDEEDDDDEDEDEDDD